MEKVLERPRAELAIDFLPKKIAREIIGLAQSRREGLFGIREIRIRRGGASSVRFNGEDLRLCSTVGVEDMEYIVEGLTRGALYAHRDSIAEGFISLPRGVRVGLCGSAAYDGDSLVGISNMTSLVFRIPTGECAFREELYRIFSLGIGRGMLIYSPPGVGKTTAIRALAAMVGSGRGAKRVAVIDERGEFDEFDYIGCEVDILRGYKKSAGIEIATRTMSPDLIMIDEIGAEDSEAILRVIKCGIPIVATAHASSKDELLSRPALRDLFAASAFDIALGISHGKDGYCLLGEKI